MKVDGVDHETVVDEVGDELARSIPVQQKVAVVHGDYRLDNTVLDEKGEVRAILDWEICTLGDPMADVGVLLCYWAEPGDATESLLGARAHDGAGLRDARPGARGLRQALESGPHTRRLLSSIRLLEIGLHHARSVRALPRRGDCGRPRQCRCLSGIYRDARRTGEADFGEVMDDEIYDRIIFLADPDLNEPVLVIGLEGWIDAGIAASTAISTMLETIPTEVLATFDTEYFIDQRARRPLARIVDGVTTELTWPEIQLRYGRDGDGADVLFLVGPEPDFHWSDFVDVVTDAAGRFDVRLVVGLGAFPAPDSRTRGPSA